jgi:anti-anti-sigma regulatory factor/PAS domain-containing protein
MGFLVSIVAAVIQIGLGATVLSARWRARSRQLYAVSSLTGAGGALVALVRIVLGAAGPGAPLDLLQTLLFCAWSTTLIALAVLVLYARRLARRRWLLYVPPVAAAMATVAVAIYWTLPGGDVYARVYRQFIAWWGAVGYMLLFSALPAALLVSLTVRSAPGTRQETLLVAASLVLRALLGSVGARLYPGVFAALAPVLGDLLALGVLAWALLRRAASAPAAQVGASLFDKVRQGVLVLDPGGVVLQCNARGSRSLGLAVQAIVGRSIESVLQASPLPDDLWQGLRTGLADDGAAAREVRYPLRGAERIVHHDLFPLGPAGTSLQGYLWLLQDVTILREQRAEADACRNALEETRTDLVDAEARIRALLEIVSSLTEAVVPIVDGVVVMPLTGRIDGPRADRITERLLSGIGAHAAKVALIDITAVPDIDPPVADRLLAAGRAAVLMGCRPVLVGIDPDAAPTFVTSGLDGSGFVALSDLRRGVEYAFELVGLELQPASGPPKLSGLFYALPPG